MYQKIAHLVNGGFLLEDRVWLSFGDFCRGLFMRTTTLASEFPGSHLKNPHLLHGEFLSGRIIVGGDCNKICLFSCSVGAFINFLFYLFF